MTPRKGVRWPLREIINAMKQQKEEGPTGFDDLDAETKAAVTADLRKFNVHANNIQGENAANSRDQAIGLIRQAELIEADAQSLRIRAYKMDPSLKPVAKKVTKVTKTNDDPA